MPAPRNYIGCCIFIDPGLGGTGWSYFVEGAGRTLFNSGVLHAPKTERWLQQCHSLGAMMLGIMRAHPAKHVCIEMPALWGGNATSYASATHHAKAGEPADLFKLTYLVGVLGNIAHDMTGNVPILISPSDWKGQLPKDAVIARIKKVWPEIKLRDHEADAIGMGLSYEDFL